MSRNVLRCLCFLLLIPVGLCAAERPNIVFFLIDDLGWSDVGFHGSEIKTPSIDKLAAAGTRLEAFYVQPVCSPTRAALMTGRYPMRHGLQVGVVRPWAQYGLPLEERTLPQALQEAGYFTAICGKWHLGHFQRAYLPTNRCFSHQYGHYNGALDYFTHERDGGFDWHRNDQVCRDEGYTTTLLGNEAVRLIEEQDSAKPLFLYVPFNAPHSPLQAPQEYLDCYRSIQDAKRQKYAAMVSCVDDQIGRVSAAIEKKGLSKNTLFVFSSDNGGPLQSGATNGPLRASKGTLYEGGTRVSAFATWPGKIEAGKIVNEPLHMVDWYPTLLALAGASREQKLPLDGRDAWPTITAGKPSPHEEILINTTPGNGAIRVGHWKLVVNGSR
ncbi:MAG TPA: arylsulfatase, partial [Pirellulaceae bacterium]|nr:arylsulfatase [Pirellulaceae bacterium]